MITLTNIPQLLSEFFALLGIIVLFISGIRSFIKLIQIELLKNKEIDFDKLRVYFASRILFALDFFIVADLVKTVFEPEINRIILLAIIVAIRTITSYSLNKEIKNTDKR